MTRLEKECSIVSMLWLWMANITSASGPARTVSREVSIPNTNSYMDYYPSNLELNWINSTTSSISISWILKTMNYSDKIVGSKVEYLITGGRFSSHLLPREVKSYTFYNLLAETKYTICIYVYVGHQGEAMQESMECSKCIEIWTIPYIRKDSVVTLLLTSSYFAFLALMGVSQWRRKVNTIKTRNRRKANDTDKSCDLNQPLRWQELEENDRRRTYLTSIEENPR